MATTSEIKATCTRCNGAGSIARYAHVADGVCFRCGSAPVARPDPVLSGWGLTRAGLLASLNRKLSWLKVVMAEGCGPDDNEIRETVTEARAELEALADPRATERWASAAAAIGLDA